MFSGTEPQRDDARIVREPDREIRVYILVTRQVVVKHDLRRASDGEARCARQGHADLTPARVLQLDNGEILFRLHHEQAVHAALGRRERAGEGEALGCPAGAPDSHGNGSLAGLRQVHEHHLLDVDHGALSLVGDRSFVLWVERQSSKGIVQVVLPDDLRLDAAPDHRELRVFVVRLEPRYDTAAQHQEQVLVPRG